MTWLSSIELFVSSFHPQALPELQRVKGVRISGAAFADCLMVIEFLHTFGDALDLGKSWENYIKHYFQDNMEYLQHDYILTWTAYEP